MYVMCICAFTPGVRAEQSISHRNPYPPPQQAKTAWAGELSGDDNKALQLAKAAGYPGTAVKEHVAKAMGFSLCVALFWRGLEHPLTPSPTLPCPAQ
jgi:hypothetical protein